MQNYFRISFLFSAMIDMQSTYDIGLEYFHNFVRNVNFIAPGTYLKARV